MSLNVKDPEVYRLAQSIAQITGESMTAAVREALRERFERLQNERSKASLAELRAIARRSAEYVKRPYLDHAEFLYDAKGIPR